MASLITLTFEMEFSASEPLKVDIPIQYILLKSPLNKDNIVEVIPLLVGGVWSSDLNDNMVKIEPSFREQKSSGIIRIPVEDTLGQEPVEEKKGGWGARVENKVPCL